MADIHLINLDLHCY